MKGAFLFLSLYKQNKRKLEDVVICVKPLMLPSDRFINYWRVNLLERSRFDR